MSGESLQQEEGPNRALKRTWREGKDEEGFKAILSERDSILDIPPDERSGQLMNRYRDIAEKIRRWKRLFPHINIKRPSKAAEKRKSADKARLSTEENRAADRARKSTERYKAADRARKSTEKYKAADRARKATDKYKAEAKERRAKKKLAEENMKAKAPEVHKFWAWEGYGGNNSCRSMRPTCILGEPVELKLDVHCYPAPTYTWKKDNKEIGKTVSGGTPLQRNPQLKEEFQQQDDASFIDNSEGINFNSTLRRVTNQRKKQSIPDFWQKGRMSCSADWYPPGTLIPKDGHATSTLKFDPTKPEDAGDYAVQVTNLHGTIDHFIRIDFTPTLVKDICLKEVQVEVGGDLTLEAEVSGARLRWYRDGEELRDSYTEERRTGKPRSPNDSRVCVRDLQVSRLMVKNCTKKDSGRYQGRAETEAGQCCTSSCYVSVDKADREGNGNNKLDQVFLSILQHDYTQYLQMMQPPQVQK